MTQKFIKIRSISPDGSAWLDDGREMQLVMGSNGSLGCVPRTKEDMIAPLDQNVGPPSMEPVAAPKGYFDISGLDQA